ncbi:ATP-binding cassette domain-containing protein [Agaribacterium haliotis]|uniref:ATP-binding cassette domain-containing protein n=1 Tax=Agaribacterium haliotis TaxID=2013869 RepID=UPI001303FFB0|nr:ATP-binding cassette domain-containing protein [Agaribacterium haliotis]
MSLHVQQLSVSVSGAELLKNINFTCEAGQLLALCGANGAGKSTLLKTLAGERDYSGSIRLGGVELAYLDAAEQARLRAVMPQQCDLNFAFSNLEVIELGLLFCRTQQEKNKVLTKLCELFQLDELLDKNYMLCSGGQKQRVQLARVVAQIFQCGGPEGKLLLLDEASSAMDLAITQKAYRGLRKLCSLGVGIVSVVHDLNVAALYADTVALLSNGSLSHFGEPAKILTKQNVEQVFCAEVQVLCAPESGRPQIYSAF